MAIIDSDKVLTDSYVALADDAPRPADGDILVSVARLKAEHEALATHRGQVGVLIGTDGCATDLQPFLGQLALVAVEFPKFTDGRGCSLARRLRRQHGFPGEIRAVGDVLRDQLLALYRCGFSTFVLRPDQDPTDALRAFDEISVRYQPLSPGDGQQFRGAIPG